MATVATLSPWPAGCSNAQPRRGGQCACRPRAADAAACGVHSTQRLTRKLRHQYPQQAPQQVPAQQVACSRARAKLWVQLAAVCSAVGGRLPLPPSSRQPKAGSPPYPGLYAGQVLAILACHAAQGVDCNNRRAACDACSGTCAHSRGGPATTAAPATQTACQPPIKFIIAWPGGWPSITPQASSFGSASLQPSSTSALTAVAAPGFITAPAQACSEIFWRGWREGHWATPTMRVAEFPCLNVVIAGGVL
jgi:hypothetical protein